MSIKAMLQHVHLESKRVKVAYLHAVLGFCPLSTLKKAIDNGWIDVMGITAKDVEMNPPRVHITPRGYMIFAHICTYLLHLYIKKNANHKLPSYTLQNKTVEITYHDNSTLHVIVSGAV